MAIPGLDDALEDFAALAGFGIGNFERGDGEFAFGVVARVGVADTHAGVVDGSQAASFEQLAQLEDLADGVERELVAAVGNRAVVLVLDFVAPFGDLLQHHPGGAQNVERLEAGDAKAHDCPPYARCGGRRRWPPARAPDLRRGRELLHVADRSGRRLRAVLRPVRARFCFGSSRR